eukprot:TRINITY_DN2104_c0_g1_i2.p1 TRINITY_DN2104_c0_g1~~TRINITY_DN2104_c0_g1_i2.p1  ORF type:complete len:311 (-),score=44.04 TRINITY_DN2104_c0_g1_i2:402-1256(-)
MVFTVAQSGYAQTLARSSSLQQRRSSSFIQSFQPLHCKSLCVRLSKRAKHVLRVQNQYAAPAKEKQQPVEDVGWEVESGGPQQRIEDGFKDQVVQIKRVSKTVKGGRQISFRAVVVIGDERGTIGVGVASAKEIITAVQKANVDARKRDNMCQLPLSKGYTFPHTVYSNYGGARIMLKPAAEGTGVIAGGALRIVLELAGVKNGFGKMMGSNNPLNNARAVMVAFKSMKTFRQVADERGVSMEYLFGQEDAIQERKQVILENYKGLDAELKQDSLNSMKAKAAR